MINICLDAMGGDFGIPVTIKGAISALNKLPIEITLVGDKESIEQELKNYPPTDKIHIVHASEEILMTESPGKAFRKKKDSSIHVGLKLVKNNECQGFVSAGNTGAVLTASTLILGRLNHIERPVLAGVIPGKLKPFVLLDLGSNVDCKPQHLYQFSIMGSIFSKIMLNVSDPSIGLLNIGEEENKGNIVTTEAQPLLANGPINFYGNIEGKEMINGIVDVVVCDGFVGNNLIKFGEGISKIFTSFFKSEAKKSILALIGLLLLKPSFKRFKKKYDYDEHGGAHFLGINGVSIIAHGSARSKAISNAIRAAYTSISQNIPSKIEESLSEYIVAQP